MEEKKLNDDFQNNLNYILINLEKDISFANNLKEKIYFEMSKKEIIESLNYVYKNIKDWKNNYQNKEYENIINNYKKIDSIISQLELCLAEYDEQFHIEGISYSIFLIGKILYNIKKESDKNGR